jgi:hypothetical protein
MRVSRLKASNPTFADPDAGPLFSPRFILAVLLIVVGIAWIAWFYVVVRVDPTALPDKAGHLPKPGGPHFMANLHHWNYVIGYGGIFLGLIIAAHPSTPLGRGRGVVVGMLACFLIGLLWICTYYVISNNIDALPVFDDLGQYNLVVGIIFMAVGFTYATHWE